MSLVFNLILILILFAILGWSADLAVNNIRSIAKVLGLEFLILGVLLGIMTTLPELSVGVNAIMEGAGALSVGNIMGGVLVLLGLILGTTLIVSKKIATDNFLKTLILSALVILSPFFLGINGHLGALDGVIMIILYFTLLFWINYNTKKGKNAKPKLSVMTPKRRFRLGKEIIFVLVGVIIVIVSSNQIIELTLILLEKVQISELLIGLLLFSIGTNLPEIVIAITSWRQRIPDLSLFHLLSSAFSSILVLGLLAILRPIEFIVGPVYYVLVFFVTLIVILFIIFSHTDKKLSRLEGFILLLIYLAFVVVNLYFALN